jgi:hypothetical protein
MRKLLFATSILGALILTIGVFAVLANAETKKQEKANIEITETVKLLDVLLKGDYLIVHDEAMMAKGEDCTYVYDSAGKLVTSFHCTPVERPKSKTFRIVTSRANLANGPAEVIEIQFPGSTKAHRVPSF